MRIIKAKFKYFYGKKLISNFSMQDILMSN